MRCATPQVSAFGHVRSLRFLLSLAAGEVFKDWGEGLCCLRVQRTAGGQVRVDSAGGDVAGRELICESLMGALGFGERVNERQRLGRRKLDGADGVVCAMA